MGNQNSGKQAKSSANLLEGHCSIVHGDARKLSAKLSENSINVTVTSPPYFDMKDYGVDGQIGFGQSYEAYLEDLTGVFSEIHRATRDDGSLWIVIDTFRKEHEVLPLPFDLTARLRAVGWILRDVIIWKKDRTLPWIHKGTTRKIFEYILVLSKSRGPYKYHADNFRETHDLKSWWIRYPERYNPRGKSLEEIWSFDIPTQGSWGKKYIRHFCPLPQQLVHRIVRLTTDAGDVVLDPFAGTGTVPLAANALNRRAIGFELNAAYIEKFNEQVVESKVGSKPLQTPSVVDDFERQIINLRGLKYARTMLKRLKGESRAELPSQVIVTVSKKKPTEQFKIARFEYLLLFNESPSDLVKQRIKQLTLAPPLSKYGIQPDFKFAKLGLKIWRQASSHRLYAYSTTNTHSYKETIPAGAAYETVGLPILSPIRMKLEE
jgi:DNA modification methylase